MNTDPRDIKKLFDVFVMGHEPDDHASDEWGIINQRFDDLRNSDPDLCIKMLSSSVNSEKIAAAWALGDINGNKQVDALIQALNDEDPDFKLMVIHSLGKRRFSKSVDHLAKLLDDILPSIRYAAMAALGMIANHATFALLAHKLVEAKNDPERRKIIVGIDLAVSTAFIRNAVGSKTDVLTLPDSAISVLESLTQHRSIIAKESRELLEKYSALIEGVRSFE